MNNTTTFKMDRDTKLFQVILAAIRGELSTSPERKVVAWPAMAKAVGVILKANGFRFPSGYRLSDETAWLVSKGYLKRLDVAGVGHFSFPERN